MAITRRLSAAEFKSCFAEPMRRIAAGSAAAVDIWPYVDALSLDDLGVPSIGEVRYVYRDGEGRFDQVLIGTGRFNALLVVVVDLRAQTVFGHHLLDLDREYGID